LPTVPYHNPLSPWKRNNADIIAWNKELMLALKSLFLWAVMAIGIEIRAKSNDPAKYMAVKISIKDPLSFSTLFR
jgi:hypothetical protein